MPNELVGWFVRALGVSKSSWVELIFGIKRFGSPQSQTLGVDVVAWPWLLLVGHS